jgi:YbgC/YbaW family acyl-CoA thioester hydrolase
MINGNSIGGKNMAYSEMTIISESKHGHVSNVKLVDYLDQARVVWYHFCQSLGVNGVVVHLGVNYKREVFNNEVLIVRTCLERVGNTSFTLRETIVNEQNELVISAEVVLATIHPQIRMKVRVPQEIHGLMTSDQVLKSVQLADK